MYKIYCMNTSSSSPRRTYHVSPHGSDTASGSPDHPFRSIQHAAEQAQPGDTVRIHAGIYRERIDPPRGGHSVEAPITFEAAGDGEAVICGSEIVSGWCHEAGGIWRVDLPAELFGAHNPFSISIAGDWFNPMDRPHHTGDVFVNGDWLEEAPALTALESGTWFAVVENGITRLRAHFGDANPNEKLTEVTVRHVVFYPSRTGVNFITLRGLTFRHAACNWAPPTAEQPALVGTHWSKGWVIEDNRISHARCVGVSLGKYGDAFDNTSKDTAKGYVGTIERALKNNWDFDHIGSHTVRRNHISHCEQAGIVGSLGAIRSLISENHIHDIHVHRLFTGAEQAGIKIHAAIDTRIEGNHVHHTTRGIWMDWMAQGTRISRNLCHHNREDDLFLEVNHGPCVVDRNLFLSAVAVRNWSEGTVFLHNLFAGKILPLSELSRETPWHPAHQTQLAGIDYIRGGEDRYVNNLVLEPSALEAMDDRDRPIRGEARNPETQVRPSVVEGNALLPLESVRLFPENDGWRLELNPEAWKSLSGVKEVHSASLGIIQPTGLPVEDADGGPFGIECDIANGPWTDATRLPGPFARDAQSTFRLQPLL